MTAGKSENLKMLEPGKPPPKKRARKGESRGKSTVATRSTAIMEHHIWKEFPEDLFETVVARLPIDTFFRFRSVCHKWNSMLNSQSFSQQCAEVPRLHPLFYTLTRGNVNTGAMYDPRSKKWHHPTIPAFLNKLIVLPVASAGGLVCFLDFRRRCFYVCNPLTRSCRELPSRPVKVWSRMAVGMSMNEKSQGGYKILWVNCDGEYEVYDSRANSWSPGSVSSNIKLPLTLPLALNCESQTVSIGSTLYFLHSDPDGILCYDMVTEEWKQHIIPAPQHLNDHALAECGGRIILVGLLTKNAAACVCIWELQKMTLLWKEVDRMPNVWCLEFYGKQVGMTCLGNKGLLMLSLRSRHMNRLVTYDFSTKEWVKVPGCTMPHGRKRQWIACGTAFYPSFTALP